MVKKFVLGIFVLVFAIGIVSAGTSSIYIKTLPNHKVVISVLDPAATYSLLESFIKTSDSNGDVTASVTTGKSTIDVAVHVSLDGEKIFYERFEDFVVGEDISIRVDDVDITGNYVTEAEEPEEVVEETEGLVNETEESETIVEETAQLEEENAESAGITGEVIAESDSSGFSKVWYFVIGGILGLVLVLVGVRYYAMKTGNNFGAMMAKMPKVKMPKFKGRSKKPLGFTESGDAMKDIQKLEWQLASAQKEIRLLRNREKIKAAEAKLEQDREDLERLKRGE